MWESVFRFFKSRVKSSNSNYTDPLGVETYAEVEFFKHGSMGPPGSPKGATRSSTWYLWETKSGCLILGIRVQDSESGRQTTTSCKWYLWESESGCLILGVQVQDSESGRQNLGVRSWEFLMCDSECPNAADRIWVSQPQMRDD